MEALKDAVAVIRSAEQHLRSILVQAAECGDYDHLTQIAEWAKVLSSIIGGQHPSEVNADYPQTIHQTSSINVAHDPAGAKTIIASNRRTKKNRSKTARKKYPQFIREGDSLIKIGWSKTEGTTYEHKAPKEVLHALVKALCSVGSKGKRFTVEALLPLKDRTTGSDIPDYQAYLTLAWLRSTGLITQHGRQGYSLSTWTDLDQQVERNWNLIMTR